MKRQKMKCLSAIESGALLKVLRDRRSATRDCFLIEMLLHTGLRISELMSLNVGDVRGQRTLTVIGKGDKHREVPLSKLIREKLKGYLEWKASKNEAVQDDAPLFISRLGRRLSARPIQRLLKRWLREAGLSGDYTPHSLRHSFGTNLYQRTKNLRLVQDLLGHESVQTTQVYTHVSKEELAAAVELLGD